MGHLVVWHHGSTTLRFCAAKNQLCKNDEDELVQVVTVKRSEKGVDDFSDKLSDHSHPMLFSLIQNN